MLLKWQNAFEALSSNPITALKYKDPEEQFLLPWWYLVPVSSGLDKCCVLTGQKEQKPLL
jgi:hypothetical protein